MPVPLKYNFRNLRVRWATSLLTVAGITAVTLVFVMIFSMGLGIERSLVGSGHPLNIIALRTGATAESQSLVTKQQVDDVLGLSGIVKDEAGEPLVSAELVVVANLVKKDGGKANAAIRGVGLRATKLRDGLKLVEGRWFRQSVGEVVVGKGVSARFKGLKIGDTPFFRGRAWTVVGVFGAEGQSYESEIWGDVEDLKVQFKRDYSAILIRAKDSAEVDRLVSVIKGDKQFRMDAKPHVEYYRDQNMAAGMIKAMGAVMAVVLSVGAIFGAANTMYAAVAAWTREIATLRVLGFARTSIWFSFVFEAALLGLAGGLLGSCLAWLFFDNFSAGTVNWQSFSELAFNFRVTPGLGLVGAILAMLMGIAGGFFPAFRASRMTIAKALRGM